MTNRTSWLAALALCCGMSATTVQAASEPLRPCITGQEAEGLVLVLAPDLMRAIGTTCGSQLPPSSLLRQTEGPFIARYQAAADQAWFKGRAGLAKLAGPDAAQLMDSELARPMVTALAVPLLTKKLNPRDCPTIDRFVSLLSPLPPRNTAALVVAIVQLDAANKVRKGERPDLPLCPTDTTR